MIGDFFISDFAKKYRLYSEKILLYNFRRKRQLVVGFPREGR